MSRIKKLVSMIVVLCCGFNAAGAGVNTFADTVKQNVDVEVSGSEREQILDLLKRIIDKQTEQDLILEQFVDGEQGIKEEIINNNLIDTVDETAIQIDGDSKAEIRKNGLIGRYYKSANYKDITALVYEGRGNKIKLDRIGDIREDLQGMKSYTAEGKMIPEESGNFQFHIENMSDDYLWSLWINGVVISEAFEEGKIIQLDAGVEYEFRFQCSVYNHEDTLPEDIAFMWSKDGGAYSLVPSTAFIPSGKNDEAALNNINKIEIANLDPVGDADGDGIPNAWELDGFVVLKGGVVKKYNEEIHKGMEVFYTSPVDKSTDGDPYDDYEEATGINMDKSITEPGNHPLVPAYPDIRVTLVGMKTNINLKEKSTDSTKVITLDSKVTNTKALYSYDEFSKDKMDVYGGAHANAELGIGWKSGSKGLVAKGDVGATAGFKMNNMDGNTKTHVNVSEQTTIVTNKQEDLSKIESTFDSLDYAGYSVSAYYENIGSAPAYNIVPKFTLEVGGSAIDTFAGGSTSRVSSIAPDEQGPILNIDSGMVNEGKQINKSLSLTKEVVEKLMDNQPVSLKLNEVDAQVKMANANGEENRGSWIDYKAQIDPISATIVHKDPVMGAMSYKVYAEGANSEAKPSITLEQAMDIVFKNRREIIDTEGVDESGNNILLRSQLIDHKHVNGLTISMDDEDLLQEFMDLLENDTELGINEFVIRPGMTIEVETGRSSETSPAIVANSFVRGKLSAVVLPNGAKVKVVKALIKDINGTVHEIELQESEEKKFLYEEASETFINIDVEYDNVVAAEDENGNISRAKVYIPNKYKILQATEEMKMGYKYVSDVVIAEGDDGNENITDYLDDNPDGNIFVLRNVNLKTRHRYSVERKTNVHNENSIEGSSVEDLIDGDLNTVWVNDSAFGPGAPAVRLDGSHKNIDGAEFYTPNGERYNFNADADSANYGGNGFSVEEPDKTVVKFERVFYGFMRFYMGNPDPNSNVTRVSEAIPFREDVHPEIQFVKREDLEKNKGKYSSKDIFIEGYFTDNYEKGSRFTPVDSSKYSYESKNLGSDYGEVNTGLPDAKAYIISVGSTEGELLRDIEIKINGQGIKSRNISNKESTFSKLMIVEAKNKNPEILSYFMKSDNTEDSNQNFEMKILGYFSENGKQKYMPLETPLTQSYTTESNTISEKMYIGTVGQELNPKGYLVKVNTRDIGAGKLNFTFNNKAVLGLGCGEFSGGKYIPTSQEGYIFVEADRGNSRELFITYDMNNRDECVDGIFDVSIIGYFY